MNFFNQVPQKSDLPDIPAPGALPITYSTPIPAIRTPRLSAPTSTSFTTSPTLSTSALSSPTSTTSPRPSSSPGLSSGVKAAAIALPIIFVLLLVPLIYLIIRSHQIRKANEQEKSQRSSQQAMIQQPLAGAPSNGLPDAAFRSLGGTKSRPRSQQTRKSINSLGLFNFELSLSSPSEAKPMTPRISRPFSLVRLKSSRETIPDEDMERNTDRESKTSMSLHTPVIRHGPPSPFNPHFAPLDQIGIAQTRDGRTRPNRNPPTESEHPTEESTSSQLSNAETSSTDHQSLLNEPHGVTVDVRDRSLGAKDRVQPINRQPSAISYAERSSQMFVTNRYSDVSAMSDEGDHRRSSNIFPGFEDSGGAQPYRML